VAPPADRPTVATRVQTPARLTVGDRFELSLVVTAPHLSIVTGPIADSTGVFAVADEKRSTARRTASMVSTYRLSMAGFQAGRHPLPVFTFLVSREQHVDTLRSDTGSVTIASVLPPKMDDVNALAPPETFPNYLMWILPGVLVLAGVLALFLRRVFRRLRTMAELGRPPLPPWEEALESLDALPWRQWLEAQEFKPHYYALSEILKRYIERRFEFDAVEQTTTEMLASMRAHKTPMRDEVGRFFTGSDLVKYSKRVPPLEEAERAVEWVREFVIKTRPVEPAPEPAATTTPAPAGGSA
jgi:hypothetical protein